MAFYHFRSGPENPGQVTLRELIKIAFWASLEREEDRRLIFSIVYGVEIGRKSHLVYFSRALNYSVRNLVKTAPSARDSESHISVGLEGSTLRIYGIADALQIGRLTIRVIQPGQLIVKLGGRSIAYVSGEACKIIKPNLKESISSVWQNLRTNGARRLMTEQEAQFVEDTLIAMKECRHGGILVFVSEAANWKSSVQTPLRFSDDDRSEFLRDQLEFEYASREQITDSLESARLYRAVIQSHAKKIAAFTTVDGATLLNDELEVIGYGVKFAADGIIGSMSEISPFLSERRRKIKTLDDLGGMRHQSTAKFVNEVEDTVAFVLSQDGRVTVMTKEDGELRLFKQFEIAFL